MLPTYNLINAKMIIGLKLLLVLGILALIVCQTTETSLTRRDQSTFQEIEGESRSDNSEESNSSKRSLTSLDQSFKEEKKNDFEKIIEELFILNTNTSGLQRFNNTFFPHESYQSSATRIRSSAQTDVIGVRRTTEGKLEPVFEENPFIETPTYIKGNGAIVFPSETIPSRSENTLDQGTDDCVDRENIGKGFCTNVKNYPNITMYEDLLKNKFGSFFRKEEPAPPSFGNRMNTGPNEEFVCRSLEKKLYPQKIRNIKNEWTNVVQGSSELKQVLHYDECISDGNSRPACSHFVSSVIGEKSYCKQTESKKMFVVFLKEDVRSFKTEFVKVPSCCKCVIQK